MRKPTADGRPQTVRPASDGMAVGGLPSAVMIFCLLLLLTACALVEDVPPVADAGKDQTVKLSMPIVLDASKSREIDGGKIVEYRWTIIGVPKGKEAQLNQTIATTSAPQATIQLPDDEGALGVWTLELRVSDDGGNRAANEVHVTLVK